MKVQEMFDMKMGIKGNIEIDFCYRIIPEKKDPIHPRTICRLTKFFKKTKDRN